MGHTYRYCCGSCGYTAEISGGPDIGFVVKTQSGYCESCGELIDFVTEIWSPGSGLDDELTMGACPTCDQLIERQWNHGDPCPKCQGTFHEREWVGQWI